MAFIQKSLGSFSDLARAHARGARAFFPNISLFRFGVFLSGGIDSSLITVLMQDQSNRPVQSFTVGFDETEFDESPYAFAVAQHSGTEHHELRVTSSDALNIIPNLPEIYDEPFSDSSRIPTYFICRAARQNVAVALSGNAGDELLEAIIGIFGRSVYGIN